MSRAFHHALSRLNQAAFGPQEGRKTDTRTVSLDDLRQLLDDWNRLDDEHRRQHALIHDASDLLPPPGRDLPGDMTIIIEGEPQGKGRPRFARQGAFIRVFTDDRTAAYEELIQLEALRVMGGMPLMQEVTSIRRRTLAEAYQSFGHKPHFLGPVRIEMEMFHPVRASWNKAKTAGALSGHIAPTLKVDFDNCAKVFCDAFNGIVWADDTQVIRANVVRSFAEEPCVAVRVIPLDLRSA